MAPQIHWDPYYDGEPFTACGIPLSPAVHAVLKDGLTIDEVTCEECLAVYIADVEQVSPHAGAQGDDHGQ